MYYVHWRIFILVDVVTLLYMDELELHCTVHGIELNKHWKNAGLYTLATKEWEMWELLLGVNWHVRINRITIAWEPVTYEN